MGSSCVAPVRKMDACTRMPHSGQCVVGAWRRDGGAWRRLAAQGRWRWSGWNGWFPCVATPTERDDSTARSAVGGWRGYCEANGEAERLARCLASSRHRDNRVADGECGATVESEGQHADRLGDCGAQGEERRAPEAALRRGGVAGPEWEETFAEGVCVARQRAPCEAGAVVGWPVRYGRPCSSQSRLPVEYCLHCGECQRGRDGMRVVSRVRL